MFFLGQRSRTLDAVLAAVGSHQCTNARTTERLFVTMRAVAAERPREIVARFLP